MTKYVCNQRGCRLAPCTLETTEPIIEGDLEFCPLEGEASWEKIREIHKDQAVLFVYDEVRL